MSGLAVGGGFAGVTALAGGDSAAAKRAFMAGDLIGGIFGGGADDVLKAIGKGAKFAYAMDHARRFARFQAGGAAIGGAIGWANGGVDGALMGANLGSMAGGIFANFAVACFTAGTPLVVDLDCSSRPIEEIEVGEFVLARSEFDPEGPLELKRVEEKFVRTAVVMELVIEGQSIKTTAEHPFYVPARQAFVPAGELKAGDKLVSHDGRLIEIASVCSTDAVATVYNLRVANHHTYFVGGTIWGWDVWVHNADYVVPKGSPLFPNSKQIEYGDGLSTIAKERRTAGGIRSGANVAVYEYLQDGVTKTKLFKSVQTKTTSLHSEDVAAIWLKKQGIDPANVKRVYSEFHPCNVCDPNVRSAFPNAAIEYSWPYITSRHPISAIGREAKNAAIRGL